MMPNNSSSFSNIIHLQRLKQLDEAFGSEQTISVDVCTLAETLSCSQRNIAKLMKTLASLGWIEWSPGLGRGNKSQLTVIQNFRNVLLQLLEKQCRAGHLNEAYRYAEQFNQTSIFKRKLPDWLDDFQHQSKQGNKLISLVPYQLPICHPMWAVSSSSAFFIEAMFDTLVRFDKETGKIKPHLAHHYQQEDRRLSLRIRPNVLFHNGVRITAKHIAACFEERIATPHPYSPLFRHIKQIESKDDWVIFTMSQNDPIFLNVLADIRSAVFLNNNNPLNNQPIGTGPYQMDSSHQDHWTLKRNDNYFGLGGIIERAEFWSASSNASINNAHIHQSRVEDNMNVDDVECRDLHGCETIQFYHHSNMLSINERAWLVDQIRQYAEQRDNENTPLANSLLSYHHNRGFHLFINELTKPCRPVSVLIDSRTDNIHMYPLCDYLEEQGITIHRQYADDKNSSTITKNIAVDIRCSSTVSGDDLALEYYEWLIASPMFTRSLSVKEQQSMTHFIDKLMQESDSREDFMSKLYRAEDRLIQNCLYVPLWREKVTFKIANNLYGTATNNMGVLSLATLWLES